MKSSEYTAYVGEKRRKEEKSVVTEKIFFCFFSE